MFAARNMVGPLSPPLLESGWTDFDAVWCLTYPDGTPVSLRRNHESIYRPLAAMHERYIRQTDRHAYGNTDSLACQP